MSYGRIIYAGLLCGVASASFACEMPALVAIPSKDAIAGKEQQITDALAVYYQGMQAYTSCVQQELTAAGGDSAQPVVKAVLVQRNNAAVAEVQAVMKIYKDTVGEAAAAGAQPAAPGDKSKEGKDENRRRHGH